MKRWLLLLALCGSAWAQGHVLAPVNGGTGDNTLTLHGVLLGQGTSAVTAAGPATAGWCLIANGVLADPSFQACPGVTSIQPQNNGVDYGSPQTGAVVMNFANCTVSATFTITCPSPTTYSGIAPIAVTGTNISLQNSAAANVTAALGTDTKYFTASGSAATAGHSIIGDAQGGIVDSGHAEYTGTFTTVNGTTNQINSSAPSGPSTTLSLSSTLLFPGTITMGANAADFASATSFKIPSYAGGVTAADGTIAFNTTAKSFHGYQNGADAIFATYKSAPTNGQCATWVTDGTTFVLGSVACAAGTVTSVAATGDGTVLNSTVTGSPITGSGTLAFSLANVAAYDILGNNTGSPAAPTYFAQDLLSNTHQDTVAASPVLGDLIYGNATPKWERLPGNTTTQLKFLAQTGTGTVSATPVWTAIPASGLLTYFFTHFAASPAVAGYLQFSSTTDSTRTTQTFTAPGTGTALQNWISDGGSLTNVPFLSDGVIHCHVHAAVNSTSGKKYAIYEEVWESDSAGADVAKIATTEITPLLTASETEYDLDTFLTNAYFFAATTSRLTVRTIVDVSGVGGTNNVLLYYGGSGGAPPQSKDVRCEFPIPGSVSGGTVTGTSSQYYTALWSGTSSLTGTAPVVNGLLNSTSLSAYPAYTVTPVLGTDNSVAGTLQVANGAANAHTKWASGATTSNTVAGPATVITTGNVIDSSSTGTTTTLHDSGLATAAVVTSASGTSPITVTGSGTNSITVACPTCVTGPSVNTVGGIMGGYSGTGSASTGQVFSPWDAATTTARSVMPFGAFYRNFSVYLTTAPAISPNWLWFVRGTGIAAGMDTSTDTGRLVVQAGASAGVVHEHDTSAPLYVGAGLFTYAEQWSVSSSAGFGLTIAGYSWDLVGTASQPLVHTINSRTIAGSTSVYGGPSQASTATLVETTESNTTVFLPCSGTIKNLCFATNSSQPSGGALSCTVRLLHSGSYSSTSLVATVPTSGVAQEQCDTTHTQAITAGDGIDFLYANASASTSAQLSSCGLEFAPSDTCTGIVVFNREGVSTHYANGDDYVPAFAAGLRSGGAANEPLVRAPVPRALTAQNLYCSYSSPPGTSNLVLSLVKNGTGGAVTTTVHTTDACGSPPCVATDLVHNMTYAQWDNWDFEANQTSGATAQWNNCSVGIYP